MKRLTRQFALCLENTGSEASLILGKVYRVVPDARAAKDDLFRHADVKTTQRYLNITDEELRQAMTGVWERRQQLRAVGE